MGVEFDDNSVGSSVDLSQRMNPVTPTGNTNNSFFQRIVKKIFKVEGAKAQYILLGMAVLFFILSGLVAYLFLRTPGSSGAPNSTRGGNGTGEFIPPEFIQQNQQQPQ